MIGMKPKSELSHRFFDNRASDTISAVLDLGPLIMLKFESAADHSEKKIFEQIYCENVYVRSIRDTVKSMTSSLSGHK